MKRVVLLLTLLVFVSCSKDDSTPPPPTKYTVSISLDPTNGGSVSPNGGQFNEGQTVSFTVNPSENYIFKNWSGSFTSSDNPLSLTITSNQTLTVNFEEKSDIDGDGVYDDFDLDNNTREGVPVDENGVMLNPIYLDENGITIKSQEWGIVGDTGIIDDVEYIIVSNYGLNEYVQYGGTPVVTSLVTNMKDMFSRNKNLDTYNWEGISSWDVSNVTDMECMFCYQDFNEDISNWDVSSVTDMRVMFFQSQFNGDISNWNVSNVTDMDSMFSGSSFNQDIGNWNVENVTNMIYMFFDSQFNQDISSWDVSNVSDMTSMFNKTTNFNQDLSGWDVSNVVGCSGFSRNNEVWTLPKPNFTNCNPD